MSSIRDRSKAASRRCRIVCPCCLRQSVKWDVWYDCACFQGGRDDFETCKLPECVVDGALSGPRVQQIATHMRSLGCDAKPSPGMLDYLTPGWRRIEE